MHTTARRVCGLCASLAVAILFLAAIAALAGCEEQHAPKAQQPPSLTFPQGASVYFQHESETDAGGSESRQEAAGTGAGLQTNAPEVAADFNTSAPTASLSKGASGGTADIGLKLSAGGNTTPYLIGAVLALLSAGGLAYLRRWRAAVCAVGVAAALAVFAWSPIVAVLVLAGVALAGVALLTQGEGSAERFREALRAVTAGIEDLDDRERSEAKAAIESHADDRDRSTIKAVKQADGLPSERARKR